MKSYTTIALTGLIVLALISPAQAQTDNPHKLIINRITRGNRRQTKNSSIIAAIGS